MPFSQLGQAILGLLVMAFLGWWFFVLVAIIKRRAAFVVWAFWWCAAAWWLAVAITPAEIAPELRLGVLVAWALALCAWPLGVLARRHYSSN